MAYYERKLLFNSLDLTDQIRNRPATINNYVNTDIPKEHFTTINNNELVNHVIDKFRIVPIVIHEEKKVVRQPEDCKVDVSKDPRRDIRNRNRPALVNGTAITIELPCTGDQFLLEAKPNPTPTVRPIGEVKTTSEGDLTIVMTFRRPIDDNQELFKKDIERNISIIKECVGYSKNQVDGFNKRLPQIAQEVVGRRAKQIKDQHQLIEMLNIPLKKREGAPDFEPIKIMRKITKPLPVAFKEALKPEPGIEDSDYGNILKLIRHVGISFEKTPKTYLVHDEEELRDIILSHLNAVYEGAAKGEVFNKKGKTDILIEDDTRSAFIAECKVWAGEKVLHEAIDQLLGYLTWRDCKTALLVFNRKNRNFSQILDKLESIVIGHASFLNSQGRKKDNEWMFKFRAKDDEGGMITISVMIFNLYTPEE